MITWRLSLLVFAISALATFPARADRGSKGKRAPKMLRVDRVLYEVSTYDNSRPGYPSTGSKTYELTAKSHPKGKKAFEALMRHLLEDTTYAGQLPLGDYIELRIANNKAALEVIEKKGPRDHGPPSGSGRTTSLSLYIGKRLIYSFRHDRWDRKVYSGPYVRELQSVIQSTKPIRVEAGELAPIPIESVRKPR